MRVFQDAAWLLLGVMLGTGTCFVLVDQPPAGATSSVAPLVSMAVFVMLVGSVHGDRKPLPVRRR